MSQKTVRKLLAFLLTLAMVAGLLPGMSLTAYADTFYGDYLVTDSDTSQTLQNKIVHFNDKEWYIIADASAAANEGTLTLFAKDPIDTSRFNEKLDEGNAYNSSKIKGYLDGLTTGDGSFAGMADAIVPTDLTDVNVTGAKLYLLSREEAKALCNDVRKSLSVPGTIEKKWWLRSSSSGNSNAVAYVDGKTGDVDGYGHNLIAEFGVRPALNLDLSKVTFDSTTSTFSLPTTYPLWVGGVQVASGNRSGDGWRYDATNNTLTLNGFGYEGSADGIFYDGNNDLTIELTGTNTITTAGEVNHGIEISTIADLTLLGTGSLSVDCPDALAIYSASVFSNITFKSGTVTAQGSNGISVQGNIIIEGGTVNASATGENGYGIQSKEGSVEISSGNVIAAGKNQAIVGNVKNAVPGVGWSNTEGTQGKADIAVSETGRSLPHKKVQFLAPIAKLPQTAPAAPVVTATTADSITVKTVRGVEFSIDGEHWQTSGTFTGLNPDTTYVVQARKPETERYGASPASKTVVNTPAAQSQPASQFWVWNILNVFNILNRTRQTVTTWNLWSSVRTIWTPWWLRR